MPWILEGESPTGTYATDSQLLIILILSVNKVCCRYCCLQAVLHIDCSSRIAYENSMDMTMFVISLLPCIFLFLFPLDFPLFSFMFPF